jgi:hypothetical protein
MILRRLLIACLLVMNSSSVFAKDDFVGDWYSCSLELVGTPHFYVLQISKTGSTYDVLQEQRVHSSFIGKGKLVNGQLHVKGCYYYDEKAVDGCDALNPPLVSKFKKSDFKRKLKNLDSSLKKGEWIRISKKEGELTKLTDRCRELAEQQNLDKDGWSKDL